MRYQAERVPEHPDRGSDAHTAYGGLSLRLGLQEPYFASLSSSVLYFGASSITFLKNAGSCAASSLGGGVVRAATGVPISLKNSSWPAGEQMQSILTGFDEALWNW